MTTGIPGTTGKTRVFFMIADPIEQVRTPEVFNRVLPLCGVDAVMVPLQVSPAHFDETITSLFQSSTTAGAVLSIPHKSAACALVKHRSKIAASANAVNAIRRNAQGELEGDIFDGLGFVKSLDRYAMPYIGKSVLVIGAGGAGCAIATALGAQGIASLAVYDPDTAKAVELAAAVQTHFSVPSKAAANNDPEGFELIINASPLGLKAGDPLPVPPERLSAGAQVCDILMKNQPTPLLQRAMARGHAVQPGFDMLILQTPLFLDYFGLPQVGDFLRRDDSIVREMLVPPELLSMLEPA